MLNPNLRHEDDTEIPTLWLLLQGLRAQGLGLRG